jgi:linoleoyl-CoA desaturase
MEKTRIKPKIIFSPKIKPDFINELRMEVNGYFSQKNISKYGNADLVVKSLFMGSLYVVPYILMITGIIYSVPLIILSWIIMGFGMAGLGMVLMHDANHGSFSKNPKVNAMLSKSLYFLGGFPPNWQYQHNTLHHGFTNIEGHDEDIDPGEFLRFSPHKPLRKIHKFQHLYAWFLYGLMTVSWVTVKDFVRLSKYKKEGVALSGNRKYKELMNDLIIAKILYYTFFLVVPLIILPIAWYYVVLLFFAMHFISGFILTTIFQTAHVMPSSEYPLPDETGNMENNWAIHQILTTANFAPKSKILSWCIGGLNHQVEHHLFPNICHVHYKAIAPIVKKTAHKHDLPYHEQNTFIEALISHFKMLRSLGRIPYEEELEPGSIKTVSA